MISVRDVTWMSANGFHLHKWTVALIQVALNHLKKCSNELTKSSKVCQISYFWERHMYECHRAALCQELLWGNSGISWVAPLIVGISKQPAKALTGKMYWFPWKYWLHIFSPWVAPLKIYVIFFLIIHDTDAKWSPTLDIKAFQMKNLQNRGHMFYAWFDGPLWLYYNTNCKSDLSKPDGFAKC